MIEPEYSEIVINQRQNPIKSQVKVEKQTSLQASDKILSIEGCSFVQEDEYFESKVSVIGNIIFYICYIDENGEVRKQELSSEYSLEIESPYIDKTTRAQLCAEIIKTESKLIDGQLKVIATIEVTAYCENQKQVKYLSGGEGIVKKSAEKTYTKSLGIRKGAYPIEDTFDINFAVKEVLSHSANAVITAVQCGVNTIIADGEIIVSFLLLQNIEKSDIIKKEQVIPFRMEVDYDGASPDMEAYLFATVKNFKTDISVDEQTGKSTVNFSSTLIYSSQAFVNETIQITEDVFSESDELTMQNVCENISGEEKIFTSVEKLSTSSIVDSISQGSRLMATGGEKIEVTNTTIEQDKVVIDGVFSSNLYLIDEEGKFYSVLAETPIFVEVNCKIDKNAQIQSKIIIKNSNTTLKSLSSVDIEIEAVIKLKYTTIQSISFVAGVESVSQKEIDEDAISVYIPIEGESLWSLAKRINVCPDKLLETNNDLTFPLTGKERIVVYRQK